MRKEPYTFNTFLSKSITSLLHEFNFVCSGQCCRRSQHRGEVQNALAIQKEVQVEELSRMLKRSGADPAYNGNVSLSREKDPTKI